MDSLILLCWVDIPSVSRRRIHACGESVGAVGILPIDSAKACIRVTNKSRWEVSGRRFGAASKNKAPRPTPHVRAWQATRWVLFTRQKNSNKNEPNSPEPEGAPNTAALGRTAWDRLLKAQGQNRLPKGRRTKMAICTFNARTLASEACIEDLMMQARNIKYDVIGLTETRRHRPLHAVFETGEGLSLGTCDSRGDCCVGVLVSTHLAMNPATHQHRATKKRSWKRFIWIWKEDHTFFKAIVGDFSAKIGPRRTAEELHIGTHGVEWNEQGERLSEFIMTTHTIHGNSQFVKPTHLRWTRELPGGQFHIEIDHIIFNRRFCLTDVAVVPKFYAGSDHRLRARFCISVRGEKAMKFRKRSLKISINWDHFASLASEWKDSVIDNIDEEYNRLVEHLHDSATKAENLQVAERRLSSKTLELIRQRGIARATGNYQQTSELAKLCREAINNL
uniref:Reverse transcriptase domain-containing protein n=1 Tax=Haemonchus contortus TaxID=6289 RepID=A0A7I4Z4L0_HAECO